MSSRTNQYPRASAILAGLGLAAQLAAAATDGVPVAKLVVGVVSRIVTLAEDIEKRRTALQALAETARFIGESIDVVVTHRKPSEQVEHSLQGLLIVFRAIEVLFAKHRAKRPFFKALSYAFTTAGHIETLSQELSRASQQFTIVAALDTNAHAHEADARLQETNARLQDANADIRELHAEIQKNSLYIGQFRNLHDCDVDNLELIHEETSDRSRYKIHYYTVDINDVTTAHGVKNTGRVFVLRSFIQNQEFDPVGTTDYDDFLLRKVSGHDSTLERLSTLSNRHRNIAYLYGRRLGDRLTSFTVMMSGYIPISEIREPIVSIERTWDMIVQIVDALCHLDERGASWGPGLSDDIFLDDSGAPMIGLNNDLRPWKETYHLTEVCTLGRLLETCLGDHSENLNIDADSENTLVILPGGVSVPAGWSNAVRKRQIPRSVIPSFNGKISSYLQKALTKCEHEVPESMENGIVALRAAASGGTVGSAFYTVYWAHADEQDGIEVYHVEGCDEKLIYLRTRVTVPDHMKEEVRKRLGITLPDSDPLFKSFIYTYDPA